MKNNKYKFLLLVLNKLDQFVIIPRSVKDSTEVMYFEPRIVKILSGMAITWMNRDTKTLSIVLPNPSHNNDVRVVKDPTPIDKPGVVAGVVQAGPGKETSPNLALKELHNFVLDKQANDTELHNAAACWGIKGVSDMARTMLEATGLRVEISGIPKKHEPVFQPASLSNFTDPNSVQTVILKTVIFGEKTPEFVGPEKPKFDLVNCLPILAATNANGTETPDGPVLSFVDMSAQTVSLFNAPAGTR